METKLAPKHTPMSIRLEVTARDRLKAIAKYHKRTAHALATEAITRLIEEQENEIAWEKSCDEAARHYDATGLHVTHDEIGKWVNSLGTENELPPPVCHT